MSNSSKRYDEGFRRAAVSKIVEDSRPYARTARELGISEDTLRRWVQQSGHNVAPDVTQDDKDRLRRLEREVAELRMERDILKEAVGIFSRRPK